MTLEESLQGVSGEQQQQPPMLDAEPVVESGPTAAVTAADAAGGVDVSKAGTSCVGILLGVCLCCMLLIML